MDEAKVRPFAVTYYCERRDPDFDRKAHDVLVACKQLRMCVDADGNLVAEPTDGEGRVARTHTCDEKPGTRALAATGEDRPPVPGGDAGGRPSPHRRDREYARLGTLSLLAAIDLPAAWPCRWRATPTRAPTSSRSCASSTGRTPRGT